MNEITPEVLEEFKQHARKDRSTSDITVDHECKCGWSFNSKDRTSAFLMRIRLHRKVCDEWKKKD